MVKKSKTIQNVMQRPGIWLNMQLNIYTNGQKRTIDL